MTAVFQPTMDMMLARKQALEENLRLINSPENISEAEDPEKDFIERRKKKLIELSAQIASSSILRPDEVDTSVVSQGTQIDISYSLPKEPKDIMRVVVGSYIDAMTLIQTFTESPIVYLETPLIKALLGKPVKGVGQIFQKSGTIELEILKIGLSDLVEPV